MLRLLLRPFAWFWNPLQLRDSTGKVVDDLSRRRHSKHAHELNKEGQRRSPRCFKVGLENTLELGDAEESGTKSSEA